MIKILLKKQLAELLEMYFPRNRKKNKAEKRSKWFAALFVLLYISIAFGLGAMMWPLCDAFGPLGLSWLYFLMAFFMGILVGILGSVFSAYTTLYRASDNEMLLAMPIRSRDLMAARMASVFLTGFAFVLISSLPAIVVYMIQFGVTVKLLLGCLAGIVALGMIVLALTCFFGWVVALVSGIARNKSVMTTLISLLLMAVYYVVYFKISDFIRYLIENALTVGEKIESRAHVLKLMGQGFTGHPGGIAILLAAGIALLGLTMLILAKSFNRFLITNKGAKKAVYHEKKAKQSGVCPALIKREFTHFVQSPAYLLNCGLGIIMLLCGMIYLLIRYTEAGALLDRLYGTIEYEYGSGYEWIKSMIALAPALIVCMIAAMCPISAPSVSIEGQNMWILRMLPARDRDVFISKQAVQLLLTLPVAILAVLLLTSLTKAGAVDYITNVLLVLSFVCMQSALGLMLGLQKPNLNWVNETQPVKQGLPVSITLLSGMVLPLLLGLVTYLLRNVFFIGPYLWIVPALGALLINRWIFKKGGARLSELG